MQWQRKVLSIFRGKEIPTVRLRYIVVPKKTLVQGTTVLHQFGVYIVDTLTYPSLLIGVEDLAGNSLYGMYSEKDFYILGNATETDAKYIRIEHDD